MEKRLDISSVYSRDKKKVETDPISTHFSHLSHLNNSQQCKHRFSLH